MARNDARQPSAWVSISAYGRLYGLTRNTVYKLLAHQQLETYRVLKIVRIRNARPDQHQTEMPDSEKLMSSGKSC